MLQSFPTKAKSAQRSGKKLVEYSFMGGIPQKIETRSKERGLEDSEQKTCYYSKLYCQAGTFTRCPAQLLDAGWFCGFFLRIWSLENRRSYGARKKHKRLPRLAMKCFRPCFFILVSHCQAMQWPDWEPAKFSFAQLWGSSLCLCVSVHHQANLRWHAQKLLCNRRKA